MSEVKSALGLFHVALPPTTHLTNDFLHFCSQLSLTRPHHSKQCLFNLDIPKGSAACGYKQVTLTTLTQISCSCSAPHKALCPTTPLQCNSRGPQEMSPCAQGPHCQPTKGYLAHSASHMSRELASWVVSTVGATFSPCPPTSNPWPLCSYSYSFSRC